MSHITADIHTTREALRGLVMAGVDPVVIGFGKGFIGNTSTGFTFDPTGADWYTSPEAAEAVASDLGNVYTNRGYRRSPFRVVSLKTALSHRLLDLHSAQDLFL
ncbi:MAG: hypothetical protein ACRDC7_10920 [Aeromonas veronii]